MLSYKGYRGRAVYDDETDSLFGVVTNTRDVITFVSDTVEGVEREFRTSIDVHLKSCSELGVEPSRPFDGFLNVRLTSELHERAVRTAEDSGMALEDWVSDRLGEAAMPLAAFREMSSGGGSEDNVAAVSKSAPA